MSTRNFSFRQYPDAKHRFGRAKTGGSAVVLGAPVVLGAFDTADKRRPATLVTGATAPLSGKHGLIEWEEPWTAFHGSDPVLTTASDIDQAPANTPVQVIHGDETRVLFTNTVERSFQGQRTYPGRKMVNLTGLAIDNLLTPGVGNDTDGYWAKTTTASEGWLRVTAIDTTNGRVEAQFLF